MRVKLSGFSVLELLDLVAEVGRSFELQFGGGSTHLLLEFGDDFQGVVALLILANDGTAEFLAALVVVGVEAFLDGALNTGGSDAVFLVVFLLTTPAITRDIE